MQGMLVGAASALCGPLLRAHATGITGAPGSQDQPGYYPPLLTGMRGSHPGSFEAAHGLRDGRLPGAPIDTGESYDLIVVGGGISGLSAAHFFRAAPRWRRTDSDARQPRRFRRPCQAQRVPRRRRHATANGGTLEIDSPRPYSTVASGLLRPLGIDPDALESKIEDRSSTPVCTWPAGPSSIARPSAPTGWSSTRRTRRSGRFWRMLRSRVGPCRPGSDRDRYGRLSAGAIERREEGRLSRISYRNFSGPGQGRPQGRRLLPAAHDDEWAVGSDAVSALDCWASACPASAGLNLQGGSIARMGYTPAGYNDSGGSDTAFPRRQRHHRAAAGTRAHSRGPTRFDAPRTSSARASTTRAGPPDARARLRLNSTVVASSTLGAPSSAAKSCAETYAAAGLQRACPQDCVLACWNMMIPYWCRNCRRRRSGAARAGQVATGLHQRGAAQLAVPSATWVWIASMRPGVSHHRDAEPQSRRRHLSQPAQPQAADAAAHGARAVQTRPAGA